MASGDITQSASGTITADELGLRQQSTTGGDIQLDDANDANTLSAANAFAGGEMAFRDVDALAIGRVATQTIGLLTFATTPGLSTNNGDFTLHAGGSVLIDDDVLVGTAAVRMETFTGGISQNASDTITAATLGLRNSRAGDITLNEANDVNTISLVNTAAGTASFHDVDDLVIGSVTADGTLFGAISGVVTGDGTHVGGNILIDSDGLLTVNQPVTTTLGTGGLVAVDGSVLNATLTAGAGNITLDGGALDLLIHVNQTTNTTLTYTADRDIIIRSTITVNGPTSDLIVTADQDGDGIGGFWLEESSSLQDARLTASRDVTMTGSDVFATTSTSLPVGSLTESDSLWIDIDGATPQVQAGRHITLSSQSFAGTPASADIVIEGVMLASTGSIDVHANDMISVCSDQFAGADILFRDDVLLTSDVLLSAGRDVTFFEKLDDDGVNSTGSDLRIAAGRNVLWIGTVGSQAADDFESLTVTDAESIRFRSTVVINGKIDLTTTLGVSSGTIRFDQAVTTTDGGSVEITNAGQLQIANNAHLTLDGAFLQNGAGPTLLGADITTTGDAVSFLRAVSLMEDAIVIDARSGGATTGGVTFTGTVDSEVFETNSLTINTGSITRFHDTVGTTTALQSLTTDEGGTTSLNGNVTTSRTQHFLDAVVLTHNVLFVSQGVGANGQVSFMSTVNDAVSGAHSLTVNTAGTTRFNSTVGSTVELASVMTDGPGLVSLNGHITTSGQQSFGDQGLLTNDVILTSTAAGHMTFHTTVNDSAVGAHSLMIRTAGTTRFNAAVGSSVALKTVTTDDFGTTQLNGDVITTNAQTYGDDVVLTNSLVVDAGVSTLSDVTFAKSIDTSGHDLRLDAGALGEIDAVGAIFGGGALRVIDGMTQEYGAISVDTLTIDDATTSVTFHDAIAATGDVSVTSGGSMAQESTLDSGGAVAHLTTGSLSIQGATTATNTVSLISTTSRIDVTAPIAATSGHITLDAATSLTVTSAISASSMSD